MPNLLLGYIKTIHIESDRGNNEIFKRERLVTVVVGRLVAPYQTWSTWKSEDRRRNRNN